MRWSFFLEISFLRSGLQLRRSNTVWRRLPRQRRVGRSWKQRLRWKRQGKLNLIRALVKIIYLGYGKVGLVADEMESIWLLVERSLISRQRRELWRERQRRMPLRWRPRRRQSRWEGIFYKAKVKAHKAKAEAEQVRRYLLQDQGHQGSQG